MTKVGILGGGQLARMLAQAGTKLDMEFMFLCPDEASCAADFGKHLVADYDDKAALTQLLDWSDYITYEFENIPESVVTVLENQVILHPSSEALAITSDRAKEKNLFQALGISTANFKPVDSLESLEDAVSEIGLPAILKTRSGGYDGKGQVMLQADTSLPDAWQEIGMVPCILESLVTFEREVSIIAARNTSGDIVFYPLSENHHRDGILRLSLSLQDDPMQSKAEEMIKRIMGELKYVGVLALELFQKGSELFANEMAPRVHNTGHWTIEGARTSQFENHLRAVTDQPLGETSVVSASAMINLIGNIPPRDELETIPGAELHDYQKAGRPGRKVGHVTLSADESRSNQLECDLFEKRITSALRVTGEQALATKLETNGLYQN